MDCIVEGTAKPAAPRPYLTTLAFVSVGEENRADGHRRPGAEGKRDFWSRRGYE
jgi:hypothetical protein